MCIGRAGGDLLGGVQLYSGQPMTSPFFWFSCSSQVMRGAKYSIRGLADMLFSPVMSNMASGHGLLKPSFMASLWQAGWRGRLETFHTHEKIINDQICIHIYDK